MLRERLKTITGAIQEALKHATIPSAVKQKGTIGVFITVTPACRDRENFVLELCACGWMGWKRTIGKRTATNTRAGSPEGATEALMRQIMQERDQHQPRCRDLNTEPEVAT